jgi:hypothetical protein
LASQTIHHQAAFRGARQHRARQSGLRDEFGITVQTSSRVEGM